MIEADKFYDGRVYRAEWVPNAEDESAPTLVLGIEVGEDTISHYLRTDDEKISKTKRQLAALGVSEAQMYSAQFLDNPRAVIGEAPCRFKTRLTQKGSVAVGFICDPSRELDMKAKTGLMARLKAVQVNDHGVEVDDGMIPF